MCALDRFLLTPKRQFKNMSKPVRRWAAAIYLGMMILTVIGAFAGWPGGILMLLVFCQWCALIWYIASYIPYGQRILKNVIRSTTGIDMAFN